MAKKSAKSKLMGYNPVMIWHGMTLDKGHLGQGVKIVCCICKTVYYSESISSSKPVNTSKFSLNFVRVDCYTHAVDKLRKLQSLYDIACKYT